MNDRMRCFSDGAAQQRTTRRGTAVTALATCFALLPALAAGQQVTLPLTQYEQLRARANPAPDLPSDLPARFAFEGADFELAVGGESARVTQTLRFTLFDDKPQSLPLGEAGAFIAADFGGLEGRVDISGGKGDEWQLAVRGAGSHQVRLESVVALSRDETSTRPVWRLPLRFPTAGVVRGKMSVAQEVEEIVLEGNGSGWVGRKDGAWSFAVVPGADVRFVLSGKATVPQRALLPLRFEATSATASTLTRTRLSVAGWISARVAQGQLKELRVPLPEGLTVVSARGPIAPWKVDKGVLVLTPLEPVESALAVEIDLTSPPRDAFATPLLVPQGSARTLYLAKASIPADGLLQVADPGLARAPQSQETEGLPEGIRAAGGRLFVVSDPAKPARWEAAWAEGTQVLASQIDRLLVDVAAGEGGRASYQLWAVVRNRGAQQLLFTLPPGFELVAARRDGVTIAAGTTGATGSTGGALAVPLLSQDAPQIVYLTGLLPLGLPRDDGKIEIPLPQLSAPAAQIEVRAVLPPGRSYALADASRAGVVGAPPRATPRRADNSLAQRVNSQQSAYTGPGTDAALGSPTWFFDRPPGFAEIGASWSALSATPSPLALKVESQKERKEWF
jgi:hypothetical protein